MFNLAFIPKLTRQKFALRVLIVILLVVSLILSYMLGEDAFNGVVCTYIFGGMVAASVWLGLWIGDYL